MTERRPCTVSVKGFSCSVFRTLRRAGDGVAGPLAAEEGEPSGPQVAQRVGGAWLGRAWTSGAEDVERALR